MAGVKMIAKERNGNRKGNKGRGTGWKRRNGYERYGKDMEGTERKRKGKGKERNGMNGKGREWTRKGGKGIETKGTGMEERI